MNNKLAKLLSTGCLLLLASTTFAKTTCPAARVQMVYPTEDKVFIQLEGQAWQVLGMKDEGNTKSKLAKALKAQKRQELVELTFKENLDEHCLATDTNLVVDKIKVIKKAKYKDKKNKTD